MRLVLFSFFLLLKFNLTVNWVVMMQISLVKFGVCMVKLLFCSEFVLLVEATVQ